MYEKFFEQAESLMKPFGEMVAINFRVLDDLSQKQTAFLNEIMDEGVGHSKELSGFKDMDSLFVSQKSYWQSMQGKLASNAKESFSVISQAQEKLIGLCEESFAGVGTSMEKAGFAQNTPKAAKRNLPAKSGKKKSAAKAEPEPKQEAAPEPMETTGSE